MISKTLALLSAYWLPIVTVVVVAALVLSSSARQFALGVLRLTARPLLLIAMVALIYDGTRTLAGGGGLVMTPLFDHWQSLAPASLEWLHTAIVRRMHPLAWDAGLLRVLRLPAWFVIGVLGLTLAWVGRRRQRVNIFVN